MKKTIILLFILLAIGCKSKKNTVQQNKQKTIDDCTQVPVTVEVAKPDVVKVNVLSVNKAQKERAYMLGKRVLNTCNSSKFIPFTKKEATLKVISNTTKEKLTKTCQVFRWKYGEFKDIKLVEAIRNQNDSSIVYRFKAEYQRKFVIKELRVIMNKQNQITAIKSLDWKNNF